MFVISKEFKRICSNMINIDAKFWWQYDEQYLIILLYLRMYVSKQFSCFFHRVSCHHLSPCVD